MQLKLLQLGSTATRLLQAQARTADLDLPEWVELLALRHEDRQATTDVAELPLPTGLGRFVLGQITEFGQRGATTSQLWRITRHRGYYYGGERDGVGDLLTVLDELVEHGSIVSIEPVEEPGETIHYATRYAPQ